MTTPARQMQIAVTVIIMRFMFFFFLPTPIAFRSFKHDILFEFVELVSLTLAYNAS